MPHAVFTMPFLSLLPPSASLSFKFTIHGLWPNYQDGTYPQFCESDYRFQEEEINDILQDMEYYWCGLVWTESVGNYFAETERERRAVMSAGCNQHEPPRNSLTFAPHFPPPSTLFSHFRPSYMDSNEKFWEHEWSRHGTCALKVLPSENRYFKTVLNLHKRYDLAVRCVGV